MMLVGGAPNSGGHPVWHLLLAAIVSVGVFLGIKSWEWWCAAAKRREQRCHAGPGLGVVVQAPVLGVDLDPQLTTLPSWSRPSGPLIVGVALASAGCAVVHAAAGPAHFREATAFGAFFVAASALQGTWALLVLRRVNRALLKVGAFGNAAVLLLWTVTRTVGLPIGPETWHAEAVAPPDAFTSLLELGVIVGAVALLVGREPRRHVRRHVPV